MVRLENWQNLNRPNKLAIVDKYNYLGINFNYNDRFSKAIRHLHEQANRAMLCLISKARKLKRPVDIQLELFDSLTCPILLYGCDVWGYENIMLIEKLHRKLKIFLLGVNNGLLPWLMENLGSFH